jgi:hypothetical protein
MVVVVPRGLEGIDRELGAALAGEDACVIVDRRQGERRRGDGTAPVERRRTDRRGSWQPGRGGCGG